MARKHKHYNAWENKIEKHPWLLFPKENNVSTKLILGSFPPNKFTTQSQKKTNCDMNFFYGSKDNEFWELFSESFDLDYKFPDDIERIKKYLESNNWIVSDIVLNCQRKNNSALDKDLINIIWNKDIINNILENNSIKTIYFTSKWVKEQFNRHIKINKNVNINKYILPSPSRNGLRSITRITYLEFNKKSDETATEFRKRYYHEILNRE